MKNFIFALFASASLLACSGNNSAGPENASIVEVPEGQLLMEKYCQSCHALPTSGELDKATWKNTVMVRMGAYLGIYWDTQRYYDSLPAKWLEPNEGGERVLNAGIYPKIPKLSKDEFQKITAYIVSLAPEKLNGPPGQKLIKTGTPLFREIPVQGSAVQPLVTSVRIDEKSQRIYANLIQQGFFAYDKTGRKTESLGKNGLVVQVGIGAEKFFLTDIGNMVGSDTPKGSFTTAASFSDLKTGKNQLKLEGLQRPVYATWADLDADGKEDFVLCEFGNQLGTLSWYKNLGGGKYERRLLNSEDGSTIAQVHDFNEDGKPDILVLMANADEGIDLYLNEGDGKFSKKRVLRFSPTNGSVGMELVDFDADGKMDIVYANGDNADFKPVLKPHHGIRVFRNEGNFNFKEMLYIPHSGAYGVRCRDFDLDGDLDFAVVSFYPDYRNRISDSFVIWTNKGDNTFEGSTIAGHANSRWMVMDCGDMDADGDLDLVLGAFDVKSADASEEQYNFWLQKNVPVMILENTTR